jgi:hypothetical protein
MAKLSIVKGATSVLVRLFIRDSSSLIGAGKTGLVAASFTGTKVYVARDDDGNAGGTSVTLSDVTRGTWSSGGIKEKDATNMPGIYEFGLTNASLASGARSVTYLFIGTGIVPLPLEIELTGVDNADATRFGLSALPNSTNLAKTVAAIGRGTATTGATTTSVPTSAFSPSGAIANQFAGRTILFDADTATTTLRGASAAISASSNAANPTFTVGALPAAPASGDTFSVV